jgi:hypothetical protein
LTAKTETRVPAAKSETEVPKVEAVAAQPAQEAQKAAVDHSPVAKVILAKIEASGTRKALDNIVAATFAEDIDLLRTEAPDQYAAVMEAVNKRREWLARV